jgi:hypothetical protein
MLQLAVTCGLSPIDKQATLTLFFILRKSATKAFICNYQFASRLSMMPTTGDPTITPSSMETYGTLEDWRVAFQQFSSATTQLERVRVLVDNSDAAAGQIAELRAGTHVGQLALLEQQRLRNLLRIQQKIVDQRLGDMLIAFYACLSVTRTSGDTAVNLQTSEEEEQQQCQAGAAVSSHDSISCTKRRRGRRQRMAAAFAS